MWNIDNKGHIKFHNINDTKPLFENIYGKQQEEKSREKLYDT